MSSTLSQILSINDRTAFVLQVSMHVRKCHATYSVKFFSLYFSKLPWLSLGPTWYRKLSSDLHVILCHLQLYTQIKEFKFLNGNFLISELSTTISYHPMREFSQPRVVYP